MGSGAGDPFGPRCHRGDIMGCGIIFPRESSPSAKPIKKRPSQPCDSDDVLQPGSSSEDPTPSEFSSQSDQEEEEEDDSFFGSDDSEGLYENRDANDRWPL